MAENGFENNYPMTKSIDVMREAVRWPKGLVRQSEIRPGKQKKHRYERRKVREFLRIQDGRGELAF